MSTASRSWDDLGSRVVTALGLLLIGGGALAFGGLPLLLVAAAAAGGMIWELVRMLSPGQNRAAQVLAGFAGAIVLLGLPVLPAILLMVVTGAVWLKSGKFTFAAYSAVILAGSLSFVLTRDLFWQHAFWLVAIVLVTDIAGYLCGRLLGGPKFWPRISPKKTWSGTIGGWIAAGLVGLAFSGLLGFWLIIASVLLSFASQMGDIAESAIKRAAGVKDSSNLLPGHGGLLDRFDGMVATFALWLIIAPVLLTASGAQ